MPAPMSLGYFATAITLSAFVVFRFLVVMLFAKITDIWQWKAESLAGETHAREYLINRRMSSFLRS